MEGSWKKFRILTVSDIIQTFHVHINMICSQFNKVFFQVGLGEMFGWCQKKIFQSKNSHRSKQTAAKVSKLKIKDMVLGMDLSDYKMSHMTKQLRITLLPKFRFSKKKLVRKTNCEIPLPPELCSKIRIFFL